MINQDVQEAIAESNRRFSKEFLEGDASITASVFDVNAVVFRPGDDLVRGKKQSKRFGKA